MPVAQWGPRWASVTRRFLLNDSGLLFGLSRFRGGCALVRYVRQDVKQELPRQCRRVWRIRWRAHCCDVRIFHVLSRIRAIHLAIDAGELEACRENGRRLLKGEHVAYESRHGYGRALAGTAEAMRICQVAGVQTLSMCALTPFAAGVPGFNRKAEEATP